MLIAGRITFVLCCILMGAVSSYYGEPYIHDNSDALLIIITVFSVFAGFMVAIITVLGDPASIPDGSWRTAQSRYSGLENRLVWHNWLFIFYLLTIAVVFVAAVIKKAPDIPRDFKMWIDRIYMFLGVTSFLFSFALPGALLKMQLGRLSAEIARRRKAAGIKD